MTDAEIIYHYGGAAKFAALLGLEKPGSIQRVSNWITRGIPAEIKLKHPELFGITISEIKRPPVVADPVASQEGQGVSHVT